MYFKMIGLKIIHKEKHWKGHIFVMIISCQFETLKWTPCEVIWKINIAIQI